MNDTTIREDVRDACRILSLYGVLNDVVGHVSARPADDEVLLRCRSTDEKGLLFTRTDQVAPLSFANGKLGDSGDLIIPIESPLHTAIYEARPDVKAVVHAHPPASLLCGITGTDVLPMRAYDYAPIRVILEGVAFHNSAAMIDRADRASALVETLGEANICLLRGHGIVATGTSVREATLRAIAYESAARITWRLASSGRDMIPLSEEEVGDSAGTDQAAPTAAAVHGGWTDWTWKYYLQLLAERDAGRYVPIEKGWP